MHQFHHWSPRKAQLTERSMISLVSDYSCNYSCNYSCIPFCDRGGHNHLLTSEKLHRAQMTYGLHLPLSLEYVLAFSGMDEGDTFLSDEQ